MSTKEILQDELKNALRSGDQVSKRTLRMVLSAIQLAEVDRRGDIDDSGVQVLLQKEIKARREAIEDARRAGREELVAEAEQEIAVLEKFLPEQLSEDQLRQMAREAVGQLGATGPSDIGKVMGYLMPKVRGRADGGEISKIVRELLGGEQA